MKKILYLLLAIILLLPPPAMGDVFKIGEQRGDWTTISDFIIETSPGPGEAYLKLFAEGYRLGSWVISFDINLVGQLGDEVYGELRLSVPELGVELVYTETHVYNGLDMDSIANTLSLYIGGEEVYSLSDSAVEPFDSRLNMRMYLAVQNVGGTVYIILRDDYGDYGGGDAQIYYEAELPYDGGEVTFVIEALKRGGDGSSMEIPFILNSPKDSIVYEAPQIELLDYSINAVFSISLMFLVGAIAFNLISARIRELETGEAVETVREAGRKKEGRKGRRSQR